MPIPDVSGWLHDVRDVPADYRRAGPPERRADDILEDSGSAPPAERVTPLRFRKRPVEIEAVRYQPGVNCAEVAAFTGLPHDERECFPAAEWLIPTLEGVMLASPGDWIIRGVQGEFYPVKPDIFEETYEAVYTGAEGPLALERTE